jgi:SAM-dependent methyltransferase
MIESAVTSYDEIPYEGKPLFPTHPDCLATAARLRGIPAPLASHCRVLELGCGTGGNLIPLAYALPGSRFLGIDLSGRQIAAGQKLCRELGLANIELRTASITDADASWGTFDYVICHGVFSWVPPAVQDHILWICRHLLSPQGVAYVSYNTYPGWHLRSIVRDLMRYHTARFDDPATKIGQARSILTFMARATAERDTTVSKVFAKEAKSLPDDPDYYLFHEHLEESNEPQYFHRFVARARAAGLEYLGEAWHHTQIDQLAPDIQEALQAISADLIDLEQFCDFLQGRTFRRTLLCHAEQTIVRTPEPDVIFPMVITALAQPVSDQPDVISPAAEQFRLDNDMTASTNNPLLKAALVELYRQWPLGVRFEDLLMATVRALGRPDAELAAIRPVLASLLLKGYLNHLVAVHSEEFCFASRLSQQPRASKLARLLAKKQELVPNLRHRLVPFSPADRVVLQLCDGTASQAQLAALAAGRAPDLFPCKAAGGDLDASQAVEQSLSRLLRGAVLEA